MTQCSHGLADPRMCPDCRAERLAAEPDDVDHALADVLAPGRDIPPGYVDYALAAAGDLRRVLARAGYVVLLQEDVRHLLHAATGDEPPDELVTMRVSTELAGGPDLRLVAGNATTSDDRTSEHELNQQPLT
ncbi:hypothetical protein [Nonomuraea endophytica]|uniref:hypothetical protein n=1 Tax=Nonomuraea endophytica TaxID=714136 RepID=UPI0037CB01D1